MQPLSGSQPAAGTLRLILDKSIALLLQLSASWIGDGREILGIRHT